MNFLHNGSRIIIFKVYTNFGDFLQQCALFVEFNFPSRCCGEMIGAEDSSPLLDRLEANSRYRNSAEGGHHFLREVVDLVLELLRAEVQDDVLHSPVESGHLLVNSGEQILGKFYSYYYSSIPATCRQCSCWCLAWSGGRGGRSRARGRAAPSPGTSSTRRRWRRPGQGCVSMSVYSAGGCPPAPARCIRSTAARCRTRGSSRWRPSHCSGWPGTAACSYAVQCCSAGARDT